MLNDNNRRALNRALRGDTSSFAISEWCLAVLPPGPLFCIVVTLASAVRFLNS